MRRITCVLTVLTFVFVTAATASAGSFFFSTGVADGRIAAASRPESHRKIEIESADRVVDHHVVVANSVIDGIHPSPGQHTEGDGAVAGASGRVPRRVHRADGPAGRSLLLRTPGEAARCWR